ncbi:MAG: S8 family serine peptidase, partial [Bacillota bacterium]
MLRVKSLFSTAKRNRSIAVFLVLLIIGQAFLPVSAAMPAAGVASVTQKSQNGVVEPVLADSGAQPGDQSLANKNQALLPAPKVVHAASLLSSTGTTTGGEEVMVPLLLSEGNVATPSSVVPATNVSTRGIIVRYKDNPAKDMEAQGIVTGEAGVDSSGTGDGIAGSDSGTGKTELVQVAPGADLAGTLAELRQDPQVEYAEPNYELQAQDVPNDLRYGEQWGMREIQVDNAWIDVQDALGSNAAAPVTVAVVDTGVDATHEDLAGRILAGHNAITGAVYTDDVMDNSANGHGTHVAGIIASVTNNVYGIAGVAGEFPVSILPVKVLDAAGIGTMYDVAQGIKWAADHGAKVINLSMGARLPDYPLTLAEAVEYAQKQGALVIAAAGNDNHGVEGFYPAFLPGVLPVGATGSNHHPASFSNSVTLKAPGVDILSTLPGNRYSTMSGTSQATAFASGIAAVLWTTDAAKSAGAIAGALLNGQRDYPEGPHYYWWGTVWDSHYYVLNASFALSSLSGGSNYDSLEFIQPVTNNGHVAGTTRVIIQVTNPDEVAWVNFTLDATNTLLGKVYGPADGNTEQGDVYIYDWDTTTVTDGKHQLYVTSYSNAGELTSDYLNVIVANQQQSGLFIQIVKPDGSVGAGASVSVYHLYDNPDQGNVERESVINGQADLQGQIVIPGITATDGNDFLVTAQGSEPNYLYSKIVHAPGKVTLDASGTQHVTISGRRTDDQPLGAAVIVADLQVPNLPGQAPPITPDYLGLEPVATLNAAGTAEAYLTKGLFRLRLVSAVDAYYLVKRDLAVTDSTGDIDFHPDINEVATLQLAPDMNFQSYGVELTDMGDY